jgi:predicted nicotinamide N-methyase
MAGAPDGGYRTTVQTVAIDGTAALQVRSLLDRQQYWDPDGEAARRGISPATWPLFGVLWPSGVELAARLAQRPVNPAERILEIGCGLALPSLVAHRRGANVTASDNHPLAEAFLQHNAALNGLPPLRYRHADWRADAPPLAGAVQGEFDLIVGSDLLYERDAQGDAAAFIARHAAPAAEVWIVDPDRGNRPAFNRALAALGFALTEQRIERPAAAGSERFKGRLLLYTRGG